MFIAFGQAHGTVQAVAFIIIEAAALIAASVLRPWMDKSTNSFNIAICAFNFLNAIFLLIFTDVFNQPPLVTAVVGVVLWVANAVFALVLLLMLIVTTLIVFFRENPDARYQYMADDRVSFMKSQTALNTTTELDALAATARGDKSGKYGLDLDDDAQSITSDALRRSYGSHLPLPGGTNSTTSSLVKDYSKDSSQYGNPPRSPIDPSTPLFPSDGQRGGPPSYRPSQGSMGRSSPNPYGPNVGRSSPSPYNQSSTGRASPNPFAGSNTNLTSGSGSTQRNSPSPWQRGAGYD